MAERILFVGATALTDRILREIERPQKRLYDVAAVLDLGSAASGRQRDSLAVARRLDRTVRLARPDRIIVALTERRDRLAIGALLDVCTRYGVPVEEGTTFYERLTGQIAVESLSPSDIVFAWRLRQPPIDHALRRLLGVTTALALLVGLAPLLALIAIAIRLDSGRPVLFVQERVGAHGRPFRLVKFRTMRVAREQASEWEADNRDRVTRVGRWLRRFRLDELPQLVNVLRCEMNLVGPRPHPLTNRDLFTLVGRNLNDRTGNPIAYYALRSMVLPGLTGWAQVRYRYANNLEEEIEKLRYDLYYVKHQSLWLDVRILSETAKVLIRGRGAADAQGFGDKATVIPASNLNGNVGRTTPA